MRQPEYIFLDTNVFYNDWFLNSANLRYLFHYVSNEGCTLLISELVRQEVENIQRRELCEVKGEIVKQWKRLGKLNARAPLLREDALDISYDFKGLLEDKCGNVVYIDYAEVPHELLVSKALKIEKPFLDGEKGYRDALMWLSLLQYLNRYEITGDVVYITNNKSDFFSVSKDGLRLHDHLLADIQALNVKAEIVPYDSLFKFVEAHVDKNTHALDISKTIDIAEEFLVSSALDYLENSPVALLRNALEDADVDPSIVNEILSVDAFLMDGIEDTDLLTHQVFDRTNIFLYFSYNLRTVYLTFKFTNSVYYSNKEEFDRGLVNIEVSDEYVRAGLPLRAYFDVSCIFNPINEDFNNYTVSGLKFRI